MYCAGIGLVAPTGNCSEGYYCPGNVTSPTPSNFACLAGHFCPEGSTTPLLCPPGMYQPSSGSGDCLNCPSGHYSDPSEGVQALISPPFCQQGFYCPNGTDSTQPPCSSGTFGSRIGLETLEDCSACTAGMYCEGEALTAPSGLCFAGYFCTGGSSSPTPYDNITLLINISDVIWNGNGECSIGYYCPEGSRIPSPCPTGSFSRSRAVTNASSCEPCPRGRYCSFTGPVMVTEAPPCSAGYICTGDSSTPTPDAESSDGYPCPIGTFLDITDGFNVSSCRSCVGGSFCNTSGLTSPTGFCSPGFYCPEGSTVYQPFEYVCPAGMFCPEGSTLPMSCPPGEYQQRTMQAQCELCPKGRTCVNSTADPALCPPHHYCPRGTGVNPRTCPPGTLHMITLQA